MALSGKNAIGKRLVYCGVCASPASGTHYGIPICGGCRAFYKRARIKGLVFFCSRDGSCPIRPSTEKRCKACRFRKYDILLNAVIRESRLRRLCEDNTEEAQCTYEISEHSSTSGSDCPDEQYFQSRWRTTECSKLGIQPRSGYAHLWNNPRTPHAQSLSGKSFEPHQIRLTPPLDGRIQLVTRTLYSLGQAVNAVWADHFVRWTVSQQKPLICTEVAKLLQEGNINRHLMADAVIHHNDETSARVLKFASTLPGTEEFDASSLHACLVTDWKRLICWMIQHAGDTKGTFNFHLSKPCQELLYGETLVKLMEPIKALISDIGLEQMERYLLMAVVIFEPDKEEGNSQMKALHQRYAQILFDVLKWRCSDTSQLESTCGSLVAFIKLFKLAGQLQIDVDLALRSSKENHF